MPKARCLGGTTIFPTGDDPGFDQAAARALLEAARVNETQLAERATGLYWGEPRLRPYVEQILIEAERIEGRATRAGRAAVSQVTGITSQSRSSGRCATIRMTEIPTAETMAAKEESKTHRRRGVARARRPTPREHAAARRPSRRSRARSKTTAAPCSRTYRDPLGGHWQILAALPIDRVEPTPFQRDLSEAHVGAARQARSTSSTAILDPSSPCPPATASTGRRTATTGSAR